jgi:putative MATE family efflux protein
VAPLLLRLTGPMILGLLGIQLFNLVDTFFVGRLGTHALAAMSFTFPVVFIIGGVSLGVGLGASAVVSRAIGQGDLGRVRRLTTDSLTLGVLIVTTLVVIGLSTIGPIFRALGASEDLIPLIRSYMLVWYPGTIFVVIPMVGNNCIRATGDTKTPGIIMMVGAAVNAALDPMFIFGIGPFPRLELAGAALATVIGRSITFSVALWVLGRREGMLTRPFPGLAAIRRSWGAILQVGIPGALANILVPVGIGAITRIVSGYGAAAVAGFGVASRVEALALTPVFSLRSVVAPFVGQNWGARRHDRLADGMKISARMSLVWGVAMWIAMTFLGSRIAGLFNSSPDVIRTASLYLGIVPLAYGLRGTLFLSTGTLSVLRKPLDAAALMLIQVFALYVPLATLGSRLFGLGGVFWAAVASNLVAGAAAYLWVRHIMAMRRLEHELQPVPGPDIGPGDPEADAAEV